MKPKSSLLQSDTAWAMAAGLLVLLQFFWLPGHRGSTADSFSNTSDGTLGLFRILESLFPHVQRNSSMVVPARSSALLIIAPDRLPTDREQQQLTEFVEQGGHLLFAPPAGSQFAGTNSAGLRIDSLGIHLGQRIHDSRTPPSTASGLDLNPDQIPVVSEVFGEQCLMAPETTLHLPALPDVKILLTSSEGVPEAASWSIGQGRVVVCSTSDLFSNRNLLAQQSLRLAIRLVEHTAERVRSAEASHSIVVSEYFNATAEYQQARVLLSPSLRNGSLQIVLVAIMAVWAAFRRFGPASPGPVRQRRSMTESARAIAVLQHQLRDGGTVVRGYLEYLQARFRRRFGGRLRLEETDRISRRARMEPAEVGESMRRAKALADSENVSVGEAGATLKWLIRLQRRLMMTSTQTPETES